MHADDAAFCAYFLGVLWKFALFIGVPLTVLLWADEKHKGLAFRLYLYLRAREADGRPIAAGLRARFTEFRDRKLQQAGDEDGDEFEVFGPAARRVAHARAREPRPQAE